MSVSTTTKRAAASAAPPRRYITINEAAEQLGVVPLTVRRRIATGELPAYRLGNSKTVRILADDLDALMRPIPAGGGVG